MLGIGIDCELIVDIIILKGVDQSLNQHVIYGESIEVVNGVILRQHSIRSSLPSRLVARPFDQLAHLVHVVC